jgi:hypothetical protein
VSRQEELLGLLHEIRAHLSILTELIHYHMSGNQRHEAERELRQATEKAAKSVAVCLSCPSDQPEPKE